MGTAFQPHPSALPQAVFSSVGVSVALGGSPGGERSSQGSVI